MRYYKTKIPGISITKTGVVKNINTGNILNIENNSSFVFNKKRVNLAKLILQTFNKADYKKGRIIFKDGNNKNYSIDNLEYKTKNNIINKPDEQCLIDIIKYYNGKNSIKTLKDVWSYRMQMNIILISRNFYSQYDKRDNINVFISYFNFNYPSFNKLSKQYGLSVIDAKMIVYYFLNQLINDCKRDKIIN